MTLIKIGNKNVVSGLIGIGIVVSVGVGGVIYESGQRTYSPRFNDGIQCVIAALLNIIVGSALITVTFGYITTVFQITYSWSTNQILASLFLIGSLYALAVAAWHYQRVLSVDYDADEFERAGRTVLRLLGNKIEQEPTEDEVEELSDSIISLEEHCIEPRLDGEEELTESIHSFATVFDDLVPQDQRLVVMGEHYDGAELLDDELRSLHQSLNDLRKKLHRVM